jgi:hypothetical protein
VTKNETIVFKILDVVINILVGVTIVAAILTVIWYLGIYIIEAGLLAMVLFILWVFGAGIRKSLVGGK